MLPEISVTSTAVIHVPVRDRAFIEIMRGTFDTDKGKVVQIHLWAAEGTIEEANGSLLETLTRLQHAVSAAIGQFQADDAAS